MTATTLDSLPYELKLDIIETLYDLSESKSTRIMAANAAWAKPYYHFVQEDGGQSLTHTPAYPNLKHRFKDFDSDGKWPSLKALRL
jgi:hypothetical protein